MCDGTKGPVPLELTAVTRPNLRSTHLWVLKVRVTAPARQRCVLPVSSQNALTLAYAPMTGSFDHFQGRVQLVNLIMLSW